MVPGETKEEKNMKKLNHWIHSVVDRKLLKFVAVGIVNTVVGTAIMFLSLIHI